MRKQLLTTALVMGLAMALSAVSSVAVASGPTIRIGFVADATGVGASWHRSQRQGIDLFIEEINAKGGVLGKKLELVERDSALKPDLGAKFAEELITKENCDFLLGPTSSGVALAVTKVAHQLKKIVVFHTSNSEALTTTAFQPYMFQVVPNTGIESRGVAMFLTEKKFKRYCYLGPDYEYARHYWGSFKAELHKRLPDAQVLEEAWVKLGETEFAGPIKSLVDRQPQILFSNLWGDALAGFIRQVKPTGYLQKGTVTSLFDLDMLRSIGPDMPEGLLGYARSPFYGIHNRQMKDFVAKFHEKYHQWPSDWAIMPYDGLTALTEAINKAQSTDSDKVVRALEGLHFRSLRDWRYIRAEDHMANVGVYVGWTVRDGKYPDFLIMKDVTEVPADMVWLPVDQVKKLQAGK